MNRLIEWMETEFEIAEAVLSRRSRSVVLLIAAIVGPPMLAILVMGMLAASPVTALAQGFGPMLPWVAVALSLKLMFLAMQTYLKDRAALLRF